jgi:uncharacterized protein related to proFAR isomerase
MSETTLDLLNEKTFKKLQQKVVKDLDFNDENVLEKSTRIPTFYQRYLELYIDEIRKLKKVSISLDTKYGELYKYYKYEDNHTWDNKAEIVSQINTNEDYNVLKQEQIKREFVVKYLEEVLDNIKRMSFSIKNFIDLKKFNAGMF